MSTLGELNVRITADASNYTNQLNNVQSQTNRVMGNVNNIMSSVKRTIATALGAAAIFKFGQSCIQLGSDLAEVQNVVDSVFTTMSDSVNNFAKSAASNFGLSETMAKQFVGTFGAMATSFGYTESEALKMSTTLAGLSGDVASFYNITQEEAYNKLKSIFTGETETLKELGIIMTENALNAYAQAQGISATVSQMSEQEKVALRYQYVLQQLNLANGDFAKTSDLMANQLRLLSLNFQSFKATIGQGLINIFLPIVKVLNAVIVRLQVFAQYFSAITGALFGKAQAGATSTAKATSGLGSSLGSLGNSSNNTSNALKKATNATKKTGTEAKKAKKEIGGLIGGLDEINNLSSNSTAGTSGSSPSSSTPSVGTGGIGALGDIGGPGDLDLGAGIDTSGIEAKAEKIAQIFTNMKNTIIRNKDEIISVVAGLVAGIASYFIMSKWGAIVSVIARILKPLKNLIKVFKIFGLKGFFESLLGFLGLNPVFLAIAAIIGVVTGALVYLWRTDSEFKDEVLSTWKAIKDAMKPFLDALKILLPIIGDIIKTVLVVAFKLLSKVILAIVKGAGIVFLRLLKAYTPIIKAIGKAFLKFAKDVQKDVKKIKNFNIKKWLDKKKQEVKDGLKVITTYFSNLGKDIKKKWDETIEVAKDFVINIASKVEDFKEKAIEKWDSVKDWVKDKALEIGSKVASFYDKAKETFNHAKNSIKNWALSVGAKVASMYDAAKERYNNAKTAIKSWALSVGTKVGSFYTKAKEAYNSAKSKIKSWAFSIALKVSTTASSVRGTINGIIRQINSAVMGKIKFTVPSWVPVFGGRTWRAPTIPYLAKGGLIDSPTLAMIGEAGKEAVIPLENNTQGLDLLANKLQSRMSSNNISRAGTTFGNSNNSQPQEVYNGDVIIKLDGNTVFRQSVVSILRQMKRQGITI